MLDRGNRYRDGLTRYFIIHEIAEKIESIVKSWARILATRGLEANGGVNPACLAIDVCRYHVICKALGLFIRIEAYGVNDIKTLQNFDFDSPDSCCVIWTSAKKGCTSTRS